MGTKTVRSYIFATLFALCTTLGYSQDLPPNNDARTIPATVDSTGVDTLSRKRISQDRPYDSLPVVPPQTVQDSIKPKETLTDKVTYEAKDYERISQRLKKIFLYNEAKVAYEDMKIDAGEIILNYETNTVFAKGIKDTAGGYTQGPVFVQGGNTVEPDSIKFNFDTQQAIIYGSKMEAGAGGLGGDFNIKNEVSKRVNDSVVFMQNVKFTTSEDVDNPEYYFYARRVKFVPGKKVVAGLTNMYIADVPTPIGLPFAYFPMNKEKSVSGFILPSFNDSNARGFSLQGLGYFFALSDYANLGVTGDYYTNGSYAIRADSEYKLRYKFSGRFSFSFENLLNSERGLPDFSETTVYNIRWNHSQDSKSSPNSRFSASVNLGSSDFFQQSVNQANTGNFLNNNFSSSISYNRTWNGKVPVNASITATHSQNSRTQEINMTLPTVQVNMDRVFPFAPKSGAKKGILQNINFNYSVRGENRVRTTDSLFFKPEMFRNMRSGVQHTIPIATNFKLFKHISTSVSANFQENWVFETIEQSWDREAAQVNRDTIKGFDRFHTYSVGMSMGTTVYGTFNFEKEGEDKKIKTIRHVVRPSVSLNYRPSFDQFFDTYLRTNPLLPGENELTEEEEYSRFEGGLYGSPSNMRSASMSFSLNNVIEAKIRDRDTTKTEAKKITIIKNLNFSTSYNLTVDSLRLAPINFSGAIPILDGKLDINFRGGLDVYALNSSNRRIDRLNINNGGSLFRLTGASINFGYSFNNDMFSKDKSKRDRKTNSTFAAGGRPDDLFGSGIDITGNSTRLPDDEQATGDEEEQEVTFYNFDIPWNLRVQYQVNYNNTARQNEISTHSIVFNGNVELGKRWTIGFSSGYDLVDPGFTFTNLNFARDLESWELTFNWVPFSNRGAWSFYIGIKSGVLSDIKYDTRRRPDER